MTSPARSSKLALNCGNSFSDDRERLEQERREGQRAAQFLHAVAVALLQRQQVGDVGVVLLVHMGHGDPRLRHLLGNLAAQAVDLLAPHGAPLGEVGKFDGRHAGHHRRAAAARDETLDVRVEVLDLDAPAAAGSAHEAQVDAKLARDAAHRGPAGTCSSMMLAGGAMRWTDAAAFCCGAGLAFSGADGAALGCSGTPAGFSGEAASSAFGASAAGAESVAATPESVITGSPTFTVWPFFHEDLLDLALGGRRQGDGRLLALDLAAAACPHPRPRPP